MMRRRRPLARAAIVGGAAYSVGKSRANASQAEAEQNAQIEDLQQQQYAQQQQQQYAPPPPAAAPPPPAGGMSPDAMQQLTQLGQLHEQGVLTDEEFAAQKAKILGTS